ncbi:MAG: CCA tRNA nucleotidyltransferase [Candidatus Aenigmatarchaeota archaeon]
MIDEEKIREVLKEAYKIVVPTKAEQEALLNFANKIVNIANEFAKVYNAEAVLVGSVARDTWLPGKKEIDVFIQLPLYFSREKLEEIGLIIGKRVAEAIGAEYVIEYAEHPYVRLKFQDFQADIVPCYKIKSVDEMKSSVDRSTLHNEYLKSRIGLISNEVRLLKQFLIANEIYGAEAKVNGFSGYVAELLILNYGTFLNLLKDAISWLPGKIIDVARHYDESEHYKLRKIFKSAIIVIDPVDKNRNAAAALSFYNFFKFKNLARKFLENPSIEFFLKKEVKPFTYQELVYFQIKRRTNLIVLRFKRPEVVDDIIYPQLRKFVRRILKILEQYNFKALNYDVFASEKYGYVVLEMEIFKLPKIEKRIGPIVFDIENSIRFLKKYENYLTYVENDKWVAEIPRRFEKAIDKIRDSLNKSEEILLAKGIPNYIAKEISKKYEITEESSQILKFMEEDVEFAKFLRKFFEKVKLLL